MSYSMTSLPQCSLAVTLSTQAFDPLCGYGGVKSLPLSEEQVWDHLMKLNSPKSMGSDEIHSRVLRRLADVLAKTISLKSQGSQANTLVTEKRKDHSRF